MFYYEVLASSMQYHGSTALTYQSEVALPVGAVVRIPLRAGSTLGVVSAVVTKPKFMTKDIAQMFDLPPLPKQSLKLLDWLRVFYPSPLGMTVQLFLPKSLLNKPENISVSESAELSQTKLPPLTKEQQNVLEHIKKPGTFLLHGETGSGKTRVYIELAKQHLAAGRSAIILTPEISLTSQLAADFQAVFPGQVLIAHSNLGDAERRKIWLQGLLSTEPLIIVGPRSALFSPLKDIGLIVVDECHESSYKQEQSPYYQALRVASKLSELHKSQLVLGSATPTVEDYYRAEQKGVPILRMQQLAKASDFAKASTKVIDLKDRSQFTRLQHISNELLDAVGRAMSSNEQSLLFLNRRGTARIILCQVCGWQALCPNCDLPLAYHGDSGNMRCHTCGYQAPLVLSCPVCGSADIAFKSIGTKAIVDEITKAFPSARVQRFDTDNLKAERFEQYYHSVKAGEVDILVGTQTLAKGLDLPKLSVVGIICADTSLYLPDYTAQERTYQLLSQVMGRIGRGHRESEAVIQTYQPDNPVLKAALAKDWQTFYQTEIKERQDFLFPPFCYLLKLTCRRATKAAAQKATEELASKLRRQQLKIQIIGPTPSFYEKLGGKFQWQLVVKSRSRNQLLEVIGLLPANWTYDIDPADLL
jgi:primosomal protein N' (replication factor Y) (superfamily II helicase)